MGRTFLELLSINRGHFALESGMHGDVWFDLEPVFTRPDLLQCLIDRLAAKLRRQRLSAICGPLFGGAIAGYSVALRLKIRFFFTERIVEADAAAGTTIVRYELPRALRSAVAGRRIGVVDDVINAGSAVTKSCDALRKYGADPVIFASLLTVGGSSPKELPGAYPPVVSLEHLESNLWKPDVCPLCRAGTLLVDPYAVGLVSGANRPDRDGAGHLS